MTCPILPLRDIVVFPHMIVPLFVGRKKSVKALENAMAENKQIALISQLNANVEDPNRDDLYKIGTLASILQLLKLPDGTLKVLVEGKKRIKIELNKKNSSFLNGVITELPEIDFEKITSANINALHTIFEDYLNLNKKSSNEIINIISDIKDPSKLIDTIISNLNFSIKEKQEFLELTNLLERCNKLIAKLETEIGALEAEKKVRNRVKSQMEKTQKEYYLNEQLKAIQKELGSEDDGKGEFEDIAEKIAKSKLPKEALEKVQSEFKKLKSMSSMSAEATVVRSYIDWILTLPWNKYSNIKIDLSKAKKILDEDHYGLEKIKDRIVEFLAVQKRTKSIKGPILCLVGPPGVGKTSLGKSIAKATGRQYIRMALGGVRDEAEIRGHRRTYIGSLPGKIIQGLKKTKFNNPLFLLDEIDKLGSDYRGDPSSALLEVLDPEQNKTFQDHYLELDYDLSKTLFITTANTLNLPNALLDRMEVIRIPGYTEEEKLEIAKKYLLPKITSENNLKKGECLISDNAIKTIISKYTRESGVRSLERELSKLIRKIITKIDLGSLKSINVDHKNLSRFLGAFKFNRLGIEDQNLVGITTGLAWTEVGGELLSIEAVKVSGKGRFTSTGKLGDVMKESIRAAEFYIKSNCLKLGVENNVINNHDFHIHVPEGATPKDGPSAGVAIVTSIVSSLTDIKVKNNVAMTGEITLRGRVLPIGGLKEKLLAAIRHNVKTVLIPYDNKKDLEEIQSDITSRIKVITVKFVNEIFTHALENNINSILEVSSEIPTAIKGDILPSNPSSH